MDERPDQIEEHINRTRGDLQDNLNELQDRVKGAFDWRMQFEERPMVMLGLALGGGALAAALIPRGGRRRKPYSEYVNMSKRDAERANGRATEDRGHASSRSRRENGKDDSHEAFDAIKNALLTGVAAKLGGMLGQLLNNYKEQFATSGKHDYRERERERYENRESESYRRTH